MKKILQTLFSVKNRNSHKIVTILGFKLKFKRNNYFDDWKDYAKYYIAKNPALGGKNFEVWKNAFIEVPENLFIGNNVILTSGVVIATGDCKCILGNNVHINSYTQIIGEVEMGDDIMIGPHVIITAGEHDYIQTEKPMKSMRYIRKPIKIGSDVWIGGGGDFNRWYQGF